MCGRFALIADKDDIEALFALLELEGFPPRYNIAPTQPILLVIAGPRRDPGSNLPDRRAHAGALGLDSRLAQESGRHAAAVQCTFRHGCREGVVQGGDAASPRADPGVGLLRMAAPMARAGRSPTGCGRAMAAPIAFAGLMETWAEPGGSEIDTGAILTTEANATIRHIHDRMPVVIHPQDFARWLDCVNYEPRDVADLLRPADPDFFEAIPVSDKVNKADNTGAELHEPVVLAEPEPAPAVKQVDQLSLF